MKSALWRQKRKNKRLLKENHFQVKACKIHTQKNEHNGTNSGSLLWHKNSTISFSRYTFGWSLLKSVRPLLITPCSAAMDLRSSVQTRIFRKSSLNHVLFLSCCFLPDGELSTQNKLSLLQAAAELLNAYKGRVSSRAGRTTANHPLHAQHKPSGLQRLWMQTRYLSAFTTGSERGGNEGNKIRGEEKREV